MKRILACKLVLLSVLVVMTGTIWATTEGSIEGRVRDGDDVAVAGATVQLLSESGRVVKEVTSTTTGEFTFFPVTFGRYQVAVHATGFHETRLQTTLYSASSANLNITLKTGHEEMVVRVEGRRKLVQPMSSSSQTTISKDQIETMPGGSTVSLPKLLAQTTPGVIQGPFGQTFIRGNHANIQYQIDGVQLPDSISGTFGDAVSTRNIDHMEVITGGLPAEYGERMAAVVNIVTKTGAETPSGTAELNYGSYNTMNPQVMYGGSTGESGRLHYFAAASYLTTSRGLDTPQPARYSDQGHGGEQAVHDNATGNDQFVRLDYQYNNSNKFTLNLFNSQRTYQLPNYPSSFHSGDPYFSSNYSDAYGNVATPSAGPIFNWTPPDTGDGQIEQNSYVEASWKTTLSDNMFLQVTPYFKRSGIVVQNDPVHDLAAASLIANATPTSFAMNRTVNNFGIKADQTWRINADHLFKSGVQLQTSQDAGYLTTQSDLNKAASYFGTDDHGATEALYAQDSWSVAKGLVFNFGLRYSAIQFFSNDTPPVNDYDGMWQPRVGVEYMVTDTTKIHGFWGQMFMPAPFENLRAAFAGTGSLPTGYDLKSEKDDYFEVGVSQQLGAQHVVTANTYYKAAHNMLDDNQIPNTAIDQAYNFSKGYAKGVELSISGQLTSHISEYFNYSYEEAKGYGISGGFFTFNTTTLPQNQWQMLDHVQLNTANGGLTYKTDRYWATVQGVYGSGLRTGPGNSISLPSHVTFDVSGGYIWNGDSYWSQWKTAVDITNVLDDAYPIFIANGFNGSHYAAGRQVFFRLIKDL